MRIKILAALAATALFTSAAANATVILSDNFNSENGGNTQLNDSTFTNWTVADGTVDVVRSGNFGITCRGATGACVDLDGSTANAGRFSLTNPVAFGAGDLVTATWFLSGNQRLSTAEMVLAELVFLQPVDLLDLITLNSRDGNVAAGDLANVTSRQTQISLAPGAEFFQFGLQFTAGNAGSLRLSFQDGGGTNGVGDNVGAILEDVSIAVEPRSNTVPEPGTLSLALAAFAGLIGSARRQRTHRQRV